MFRVFIACAIVCGAAAVGAATANAQDDRGYGPHLDRDNDGIGCE
jgi:hypothetical protein